MLTTDSVKNIPATKPLQLFSTSDKSIQQRFIPIFPSSAYYQSLGFFCRKEIQLEKAVRLPVRFRLGSVAYTDKMENKNNFTPAAGLIR